MIQILDLSRQSDGARLLLALGGLVIMGLMPPVPLSGSIYMLVISALVYHQTPGVRLPRSAQSILLSTLLFFSLAPAVSAWLGLTDGRPGQELSFGLGVALRIMSIFLWLFTCFGKLGIVRLLETGQRLRLPKTMLFMFMLTARYYHRFVNLARDLGAARRLRLGHAPLWRGLDALVYRIILEGMDLVEHLYQAILLRGGQVILPSGPLETHRQRGRTWEAALLAFVLLLPVILRLGKPLV